MQTILSFVETISWIPQNHQLLVAQITSALVFVVILLIVAQLSTWFCNHHLSSLVKRLKAQRWFEALKATHFFIALGVVMAAMVAVNLYPVFIGRNSSVITAIMGKVTGFFVLGSFYWLFNTFLNTLDRLYGRLPNIPVKGLIQVFKIVLFLGVGLLVVSLLLGKKPAFVITGLSAMAAVFSLIFKDTILGFAASIQLTINNLIKIGDWITVDSAGADGNILDISLTSVRVQNFDMTIVSVPTYDLVSKPFKNWNGMYQAKARRIQRSIILDVQSLKFLDEAMLARLKKIELLKDYLEQKEREIAAYNAKHNIAANAINGRRLTNIGTFRHYAQLYLESLPSVVKGDSGLTLMVRQLPPNAQGIPLEVYCFVNTTVWTEYENIQGDIFDHLLSVLPQFGLAAYQQPSGANLQQAFARQGEPKF